MNKFSTGLACFFLVFGCGLIERTESSSKDETKKSDGPDAKPAASDANSCTRADERNLTKALQNKILSSPEYKQAIPSRENTDEVFEIGGEPKLLLATESIGWGEPDTYEGAALLYQLLKDKDFPPDYFTKTIMLKAVFEIKIRDEKPQATVPDEFCTENLKIVEIKDLTEAVNYKARE